MDIAYLLRFLLIGVEASGRRATLWRMDLTQRSPLLIVVAVVLFVIAFLIAVGAVDGNAAAFGYAGLASFAGAHL